MTILIGSARSDENGKTTGGTAGDQTKSEVSTQDYYTHSKGWYILRPNSVSVANKLAQAMLDACNNDCIGYDQNQRTTLLTQYNKYGSIAKIKTNCECDCSSLVRVCILEATGTDVGNFTTDTEVNTLVNSGLFTKKTCSGSSSCYNGDVLVTKTKGHTAIVVSGRARSSTSTSSSSSSSSSSSITVDGEWGKNTTKKAQQVFGTTVDSIVSNQYKKYQSSNPGLLSETFSWKDKPSSSGSELIKAIQKKVGVTQDGYIGPNTIKAMQKWLGTTQDGYCSKPSQMVKAFQTWLNKQ